MVSWAEAERYQWVCICRESYDLQGMPTQLTAPLRPHHGPRSLHLTMTNYQSSRPPPRLPACAAPTLCLLSLHTTRLLSHHRGYRPVQHRLCAFYHDPLSLHLSKLPDFSPTNTATACAAPTLHFYHDPRSLHLSMTNYQTSRPPPRLRPVQHHLCTFYHLSASHHNRLPDFSPATTAAGLRSTVLILPFYHNLNTASGVDFIWPKKKACSSARGRLPAKNLPTYL